MSELKVINAYIPTFDADHNVMLLVSHTKENYAPAKQIECYLKSEADKVIAHHKYKRCLAMARWCNSENYTATWYHENTERCEWTEKWYERWLELAKEPTWAKFLQLIHKEAK